MTFAELKSVVADMLARTDLTSVLGNFINSSIRDLERGHLFFPDGRRISHNFKCMRVQVQQSLVEGDYSFLTPIARYKSIESMFALDSDSNIYPVRKGLYADLMLEYPDLVNHKGHPKLLSQQVVNEQLVLSMGAVDTKVASSAFDYVIAGSLYSASAAETTPASGTVPADHWGAWLFSISSSGNIYSSAAAGNASGYDTEALAKAAVPAAPDGFMGIFYVTIKTKSGSSFIPGTDALAGGASGNVASETHYYTKDNDLAPITKWLIRPTADAAYTLYIDGYQYSPDLDAAAYVSNWWTENAWDLIMYGACLEATPYLGNDTRIPVWQKFYYEKLWALVQSEVEEDWSNESLNIRTQEVID